MLGSEGHWLRSGPIEVPGLTRSYRGLWFRPAPLAVIPSLPRTSDCFRFQVTIGAHFLLLESMIQSFSFI